MPQTLRVNYYYTCAACGEVFIHHHDGPGSREALFKAVETCSPMTIGSCGKADSRGFEVRGCATLFQERGLVNIHSVVWDDSLDGFLIEANGDFLVVDNHVPLQPAIFRKTNVGKVKAIGTFGEAYCHSLDKVGCVSLSGTGKLGASAYSKSISCGFYWNSEKGAYAFVSKEEAFLFSGKFYNIGSLHLTPQRSQHEWYQ